MQMVVLSVGQMFKPDMAAKSPMATDPEIEGFSEGFSQAVSDFEGLKKASNGTYAPKGYFMDGGGVIAGYNG